MTRFTVALVFFLAFAHTTTGEIFEANQKFSTNEPAHFDYDDAVVVRFARDNPVDDDCGQESSHPNFVTILDEVKDALMQCTASGMGHSYPQKSVSIIGNTIDSHVTLEERAEVVHDAEKEGIAPKPLVDDHQLSNSHENRQLGSCNRPCIPQGHSCCISWPFICGSSGCSSCQCNRRRERRGLGESQELGQSVRHLTKEEIAAKRSQVERECTEELTALHNALINAGNKCLGSAVGTVSCTAHSQAFQTLEP